MYIIRKNLSLIAGLTLISVFALAGISLSSDAESFGNRQYRSVRAMGMGNAFIAVADDGDAFYYNPAGLATIRGTRFELQPVKLAPTQDLFGEFKDINKLIDDVKKMEKSAKPLEDPSLKDERQRLMDRVERLTRENLGFDMAVPLRIIIPIHIGNIGASIGGMVNGWTDSQIQFKKRGLAWSDFAKDMMDDEVLYRVMAELSYGLAGAVSVPVPTLPLELSFGLAATKIDRRLLTDENNLLTVQDLLEPDGSDGIEGTPDDLKNRFFDPEDPLKDIPSGKGYKMDAGVMASLFDDKVKLGVAIQNLAGKIEYKKIEDEELPQRVGVSAAVKLAKLPMTDVILTAGLDNINDDAKSRLGVEAIWKPLKFISFSGRIGSYQGYITLGAGIQLAFLDIDYAFYGDEITNWHAFSLNLAF